MRYQHGCDAIALDAVRYGENGSEWTDIIDALTTYLEARRQVVPILGEMEVNGWAWWSS